MNIIYLHGLDSDSNANKAIITARHADTLDIVTIRPNLNCPPDEVLSKIQGLVDIHKNSVLVGSSLGGYFANLVSDMTGTPAILLNPSIRPDVSFRRFLGENYGNETLADDAVIYTTSGGWQIRYRDLAWFENHRLRVNHPERLKVLLKMGDELLDSMATKDCYEMAGAFVLAQDGGDHRMSDYDDQVGQVLTWVKELGGGVR